MRSWKFKTSIELENRIEDLELAVDMFTNEKFFTCPLVKVMVQNYINEIFEIRTELRKRGART